MTTGHVCPDVSSLNGLQIWEHEYLFHRLGKWYPDTMTTPTEYNWDEINGYAVERLSKPKIKPVHPAIVRQAQRSVDRDPVHLKNTATFRHEFASVEQAEEFARQMRAAGLHTKPQSSMKVTPDPDKEGKPHLIEWYARKRPGRTPAAEPEQAEAEQAEAEVPVAAAPGVPF